MNFRLLSKLLGILSLLIGGFMLFSLVWADPGIGVHTDVRPGIVIDRAETKGCLLYTSPSPRDQRGSRMPSSA